MDTFSKVIHKITSVYKNEINTVAQQCEAFIMIMTNTLREQAKVRHVSQEEIKVKSELIRSRFEGVKAFLRTTVCEAIHITVITFGYTGKRRKRCYPRKVSHVLNTWFFEHINDPYPSEADKQKLAEECGLNMIQVCNWFANKRIRQKRAIQDTRPDLLAASSRLSSSMD